MKLTPKNWVKFQHYKDRSPPWIKLHRELLDDREFMLLPLASKALAPLLWLLASESTDGTFNASDEELIFRLRITQKDLIGLRPLIDKGFFTIASEVLADRKQDARPEGEGETERELKPLSGKPDFPPGFIRFWKAWPVSQRKQSKAKCAALWKRKGLELKADVVVAHVEALAASLDWRKSGGEFIPMPSTYLNQERWDGADLTAPESGKKPWFINGWSGIVAKGAEHGLREDEYPNAPAFRAAVLSKTGITEVQVKQAEAQWE